MSGTNRQALFEEYDSNRIRHGFTKDKPYAPLPATAFTRANSRTQYRSGREPARLSDALAPELETLTWSARWRGRWIWDRVPAAQPWWTETGPRASHFTYLRRVFEVSGLPRSLPARATCDSRYILYLNGREIGRGPARDEPAFLGWDTYELAPYLQAGANVLVALCRYYGAANPWWLPASQIGTLGSGSFCFETHETGAFEILSDESWQAVPAPWLESGSPTFGGVPSEIVDGRLSQPGLHDPRTIGSWPCAVALEASLGQVRDRPPASPYSSALRRSIPQLASRTVRPKQAPLQPRPASIVLHVDPVKAWRSLRPRAGGGSMVTSVDLGELTLGHVRLRVTGALPGDQVLVGVGEDLRDDGLPEIDPRRWVARYLCRGEDAEEVTFFDPVGCRYLAAVHPPGAVVELEVEERVYPSATTASFECDDDRYSEIWRVGARTVALCATDAFIDCPGREQRAWVGDAIVHSLVTFVTNPDWKLVRRQLELAARGRRSDGLLPMAAACDVSRSGATIPDFSLHWLRTLGAYWLYSGDEELVRSLLPVAEGIIERYEAARGASGLLENFPGWVFIEWAQIGRDIVTAAHDALYAVALNAYGSLPGASPIDDLLATTRQAFESLWDDERGVYVDTLGAAGPGRRVSQHTNAAALLSGIVPPERVARVVEAIVDPGPQACGGRLVVTATFADRPELGAEVLWERPSGFDEERDVVACQPFFCHVLHAALHRAGRADLILPSLLRWYPQVERGTFQEFWEARPGCASRCHGFSACPTYDLVSYVLGLRPTAPGYARAELTPSLGSLTRVSSRVPTPRGWITITCTEEELDIELPDSVVLEVRGHALHAGSHRVHNWSDVTVRAESP